MFAETAYMCDKAILAPLSGYTDVPFRQACRRHGCHYAFTPLVDAASLVYRNPRNTTLLLRAKDEPWLGLQLLGGSAELLAKATSMVADYDFDLIDLNMGCPVLKVTKRGAGAGLSMDIERARRCVEAVLSNSRVPVTAKIRILSAKDPAPTIKLARALEECGIAALTIHGREWEKIYSGPVAFEVIRAVREALKIPVIANGGVFDWVSAQELRERTGCRYVMIARGAIGNPWIFRELCEEREVLPSSEEVCEEMELHVRGMVELYGESVAMRNARKIILAYMKGRGFKRVWRAGVSAIWTMADFQRLLDKARTEGVSIRFNPSHDVRIGRRLIAEGDVR